MTGYIWCILYVIFSVGGLTLVKLSTLKDYKSIISIPVLDMKLTAISLLGILCYGVSFCIYLAVISRYDLGIIIPILSGVVNILILLVALTILKEKLTPNMVIGAVIIIVGVVIMNIKK